MSYTLTQAAKDELDKAMPEFVKRAYLVKEHLSANRTTAEITDKVISWGKLRSRTTAVGRSWERPNLTMLVDNATGFFTEELATSFFALAPVTDQLDCTLLIEVYVVVNGVLEQIREYRGQIMNISVTMINRATATIKTVTEHNRGMSTPLTKKSGGRFTVADGGWF